MSSDPPGHEDFLLSNRGHRATHLATWLMAAALPGLFYSDYCYQ